MYKVLLHSSKLCLFASFVAFTFLLLFGSSKTFATLYINEFASDTAGTIVDSDWVEIFNNGPDPVDLSLYKFKDGSTNNLALSGTISVNGFVTFAWSNKLNKTGDLIKMVLVSDETVVISEVGYGDRGGDLVAPSPGQSGGRQTDGSASWVVFSSPTKNSTNNGSGVAPSPSPSPTPLSSSPSPSPSPLPSQSPKASPSPSPKASSSPVPSAVAASSLKLSPALTKKPSPKLSPKSSPRPSPSPEEVVLAATTVSPPSPIPEPVKEVKSFWSSLVGVNLVGTVLSVLGVGLLGLAGYSFFAGRGSDRIGS